MISNRLRRRAGFLAAVVLLSASGSALSGCTLVEPVTANRGYVINETDLKKIKIGVSTSEQVTEYMGSPSTTSTDDGVAFYYITSKTEAFLFEPAEEVERTVIAVYFDKTNVAQEVLYYGLQDGEIVNLQTRTTPTRGKELTILGQLFGNLGRFNKQTAPTAGVPRPGGH